MSTLLRIATIQASFSKSKESNIEAMDTSIRDAAALGAQIILLPELFEGEYFPQQQEERFFAKALPVIGHPTIEYFRNLAAELKVVLPISFYERDAQELYNSVAMIDADGTLLGIYRKSHIPDGPGYQEKFYFRPGNTGFKVWNTRYANIGVGICWDQWFPEAARTMVLAGADILLYPTAIGSEPKAPKIDTRRPWQRVMQGQAVANACIIAAANRVGIENDICFYGSSFICDMRGEILAEASQHLSEIIYADIDLIETKNYRDAFGFFRDRRPDLYLENEPPSHPTPKKKANL